MILYFTGTGNSAFVAKQLAEELQDELISLNELIKSGIHSPIKSKKPLVFVVPTYAWRIPEIVTEWIEKTDFSDNLHVYFIMTCGSEIGNAEGYIAALCQKKNLILHGVTGILMPENYIALYDVPGEDEARQIILRAEPSIKKCADRIAEEGVLQESAITISDRIKSSIVNRLFYPIVVKADKFRAEDSCIGCGKCVAECPFNNIKLQDKKPVWGSACTHCMACISKCPAGAIEYGKNSIGKRRYQCPKML